MLRHYLLDLPPLDYLIPKGFLAVVAELVDGSFVRSTGVWLRAAVFEVEPHSEILCEGFGVFVGSLRTDFGSC